MKKLLALFLAALMTATLFTVPAFAADAGAYVNDEDMTGVSYTQGTKSWVVNIDPAAADTTVLAATEMTSSASNYSIAGSGGATTKAAVYSLPLPTVPEGKNIKTVEFRVSSRYTTARAIDHSYKMPGEHNMSTITIGDMQKFVPGNNLGGGEYYLAPVQTGEEYYSGAIYRNRYDVTDYIKECIAAGQANVFIALAHGYSVNAYRHANENKAKLYYTLEDVPALTAESSVPEADATGVYPIGNASVTFSNVIKSATATINGAEVPASDISISEKTVTVAYDLGLSQATELVVSVKDITNQELSHTINFTTDSKYAYYNDSDITGITGINTIIAEATWLLTYDATAEDTSALAADAASTTADSNAIGNSKKAVVYKVKLPEVPEGKAIDFAEFRATSKYSLDEQREIPYAYKMPGQNWDMSAITIADAQKIIDGSNLGAGNNYIGSCTKDPSYIIDRDYRNKYSVSEYVAECIANGQEYMYIALTRPSSGVNIYAHTDSTSRRKPKLFYTLKDAPVVKEAKVVLANSEADYADAADIAPAKGQSIKAISYMANATNADVNLMVGVAQYKGDELISLSFVPHKLLAGAEASTVSFGNVTVDANADKVKAIIWDASYNPVTKAKILEVNQ